MADRPRTPSHRGRSGSTGRSKTPDKAQAGGGNSSAGRKQQRRGKQQRGRDGGGPSFEAGELQVAASRSGKLGGGAQRAVVSEMPSMRRK